MLIILFSVGLSYTVIGGAGHGQGWEVIIVFFVGSVIRCVILPETRFKPHYTCYANISSADTTVYSAMA
jgi:hypothetical protein